MRRIAGLIMASSILMLQSASGDEVRHTAFAGAIVGTWAPTADRCGANDKSSIAISKTNYSDANGSCSVEWIVETAGSLGPNYSVHATCADASRPGKTHEANLIMRPESNGISIGTSFNDLKTYQRCPEK
jgi:hypothetical protein